MRKSKRKKSPIWPYLGILGCLFLLSLTAPRAWNRHARNAPITQVLPGDARLAPETVETLPRLPAPESLEPADETELAPREPEFTAFEFPELPMTAAPVVDEEPIPYAPPYAEEVCENPQLALLPSIQELPETEPALSEPETPLDEQPELQAPPESPVVLPAETEPKAEPVAEEEPEERLESVEVAERWPIPRKLVEQLTELVHEDGQLVWMRRSLQLINDHCRAEDPEHARELLAELREIVERGGQLRASDATLQPQVARARYALTRWLDVWEGALDLEPIALDDRIDQVPPAKIATVLDEFDSLARRSPAGDGWREYLKLDELRTLLNGESNETDRRREARAILARLHSSSLSSEQRKFARQGVLAELGESLQTWAAEPVPVRDMLAHLEQYEYTGLNSDAQVVADDYKSLLWSRPEQAMVLGRHLDTHYRNANLRVAVRGELANRLVPQPERIDAPVRDIVVNVPVRGHSSTFTELAIKLVPDDKRIRVGLEAHGVVASNTVSDAGPAKFRNRGQSTFLVRKLFVVGPRGLHVWPAIAEAENNYNYLVSLETDYDGVPLFGSLVRNIARTQHDEKSGQARRQTEAKVAIQALHQLDNEVDTRLAEAEKKMQDNQVATLHRLGLELTPISLVTTEERVVARVRLAGQDQLGAHTPRPRAPSDSWFSMQLHQSALNNGIEKLDLDGRSFTLTELFAWIAKKLGHPELAEQEDLPENVQIRFADQDAVRLECEDDRVKVTFGIAELTQDGHVWRDFQVRAYYIAQADGLSPQLVRDPDPQYSIKLDGDSMRGKINVRLRAIFSRVLSKNRDLRLLAESVTGDSRFKDLRMTQFDVADGWIALAYSPRRETTKTARRPE